MIRRVLMAVCLGAFILGLGCESDNKPTNPSNLEYNKEGPPKRDGVKPPKT
jgi:hypothetical protein